METFLQKRKEKQEKHNPLTPTVHRYPMKRKIEGVKKKKPVMNRFSKTGVLKTHFEKRHDVLLVLQAKMLSLHQLCPIHIY